MLVNYPQDLINLRLYTLVTAGFLHGSLSHLIGNMIDIFIFGRVVERKLGFIKTSLVYFGSLLIKKVDSFSRLPYESTVRLETEACLTSEFGMGSGEPSPYGRPR